MGSLPGDRKRPSCPECGGSLFAYEKMDKKTDEIQVLLMCENDDMAFEISTGLTDEDIAEFHEKDKPIRREMITKLLWREPLE